MFQYIFNAIFWDSQKFKGLKSYIIFWSCSPKFLILNFNEDMALSAKLGVHSDCHCEALYFLNLIYKKLNLFENSFILLVKLVRTFNKYQETHQRNFIHAIQTMKIASAKTLNCVSVRRDYLIKYVVSSPSTFKQLLHKLFSG